MKRTYKILLALGGFFTVLLIAVVVVIATVDWNRAKPYVSRAVAKATGREFSIDGDLALKFGWITRLSVGQIKLQNASWSKNAHMVDIGQLDAQLDVHQLLRGRVLLPEVALSQVKVFLEKNAKGEANWDLGASTTLADTAVPKTRTRFPVIQKLLVRDGVVLFDNRQTGAQLDLRIVNADAGGFLQAPVTLKAQGSYQKLPMTLTFDGGSYENLRDDRQLYPLRIDLTAGKLKAKITGDLVEPLEMKGENVTLDVQGDDMANLYPLLRLVFPSTPPYRLKGHLNHEGNVWTFSKFSGNVGGSDLAGDIRVDTGPERHVMKADLVSNKLDFKDLAGFVGGNPGNKSDSKEPTKKEAPKDNSSTPENDRIFPDQHYDLQKLRSMDADVRLRAKQVLAPNLPIDDLNAKLILTNGVLRFTPATFGVADGRLEIFSTFDASKQTPKVNIDARIRQLNLKRFLGANSFAEKTLGPIGGRIVLAGTGNSFRELMATASGQSFLAIGSGEISDLLVRLAGLNVARALGVLVRGDKPIPVRCGLLNLEGTNGQMDVKTLVFDTGTTVVSGQGTVDLRDEKVNITIIPVPKDFSPFSLRSYIRVSGPLKHISAFPDPIKTGTDNIFKKALNVLIILALSPFQPRDLGLAKDVDCDALMAQIGTQDSQKVIPNHPAGKSTPQDAKADQAQGKRG